MIELLQFLKVYRRTFMLLEKTDRVRLIFIGLLQTFLSLLDLVGIVFIGAVAGVAVAEISQGQEGSRVSAVLRILNLQNLAPQTQVTILGSLAALFLIGKTFFSMFFTRRIMHYMSSQSAVISSKLTLQLMRRPLFDVRQQSIQSNIYSLTSGVSNLTVGVIGVSITALSDMALFLVITTGLFLIDPLMALGVTVGLSFIGFALWLALHRRARFLGAERYQVSIQNSQSLYEVMHAYREFFVRGRRDYLSKKLSEQQFKMSKLTAEISFLPNISKYTMDIGVIVLAILISAYQFTSTNAYDALATLAIFLAATSRIAPAVLRFQQSIIQIRSNVAQADPTFELIHRVGISESLDYVYDIPDLIYADFKATVSFKEVNYSYPSSHQPLITSLSFDINAGGSIGIVGASGVGKTTLVDLLLGILEPSSGVVRISGMPPVEAMKKYAGAVAYVPQDSTIFSGSIRENLALGFPTEAFSDDQYWEALSIAQLDDVVKSLTLGLDSHVGDLGSKLSGGQRQRLGIARSLITKPKLIVLDEATSAMDFELENRFLNSLIDWREDLTIFAIAHRITALRNFNSILFLPNRGKPIIGSFDNIKHLLIDSKDLK